MNCKKFVSWILAIALMATLFMGIVPLSASAAADGHFTVGSATASTVDETVTVTINATYTDFVSYSFTLNYDKTKFDLVSFTQHPSYIVGTATCGTPGIFIFLSGFSNSYSGPIAIAEFKLKAGATAGNYGLNLSNLSAYTFPVTNPTSAPSSSTSGSITLTSPDPQNWVDYDAAYAALTDAYTNPTEKAKYTADSYAIFEGLVADFLANGALDRDDPTISQGVIDAVTNEMNRILGLLVLRIPATSLTLNKTSSELVLGTADQLIATLTPGTTTDRVIWSSSDPAVASVSSSGLVLAAAVGTAIITATNQDDPAMTASCTVTVITPATGVTLPATAKVAIGATITLKATVSPSTANQAVTWKSSDTSIATISAAGVVKGIKTGKVTITVTTVDGNKTATCVVTVGVPATGITVPSGTTDVTLGQTVLPKVTISPSDSTEKPVFSSSDKSIATVDPVTGAITGKKAGTVTITVKVGSITKTFKVTVHNYVTMRIGYTKAIHNGTQTVVDDEGTKPFLIDGRTMVPLRFVGTRMGGKVKYTNASEPILLTYDGITVEIKLNSNVMNVIDADGKKTSVTIDVAAQLRGSKTYIPLRAVSQALGFTVFYDDATKLIVVNNPKMGAALREVRLAEAKPYIK